MGNGTPKRGSHHTKYAISSPALNTPCLVRKQKPESLNEALVKSPKDMLLFSKKARQVDYKPCTLKEYRESKPTGYVELGKLQPDLYTDELVAKVMYVLPKTCSRTLLCIYTIERSLLYRVSSRQQYLGQRVRKTFQKHAYTAFFLCDEKFENQRGFNAPPDPRHASQPLSLTTFPNACTKNAARQRRANQGVFRQPPQDQL